MTAERYPSAGPPRRASAAGDRARLQAVGAGLRQAFDLPSDLPVGAFDDLLRRIAEAER